MNDLVRSTKNNTKPPAFAIRHRVELELDFDLALSLGDFLLANHCDNQAIVALGHQLQNLLPMEKIPEEDK